MRLDVISLGACRIIVMHGFTRANRMPCTCLHGILSFRVDELRLTPTGHKWLDELSDPSAHSFGRASPRREFVNDVEICGAVRQLPLAGGPLSLKERYSAPKPVREGETTPPPAG
jgi:hypothetical protein